MEMDGFGSSEECSSGSGCESGWTLYLEQSFVSKRPKRNQVFHSSIQNVNEDEEQEQEDMSMVSDASSGPPHFNEDHDTLHFNYNNAYFYPSTNFLNNNNNKRQKERTITKKKHNQEILANSNSFLDDTASSPAFNFSKNSYGLADNTNSNMNQASMESMLDYSQGFSATHFQGRSAYQDHFGNFVHPPLSENQYNNQWF